MRGKEKPISLPLLFPKSGLRVVILSEGAQAPERRTCFHTQGAPINHPPLNPARRSPCTMWGFRFITVHTNPVR